MPIERGSLQHPLRKVLTGREFQVLVAVAETEMTYQQAATAVGMSIHTLRDHMASVRRKLNTTTRSGAVAVYWRQMPPPPRSGW